MSKKIVIDQDACAGTGYCVRVAPSMFDLVDDKAVSLFEPDTPEREALATEAQIACPTGALWLEQAELAGPA